ncbi:hypothetical protein Hypma_006986 [Hypsizygus marmoreus]|uniref:Nephrocystin 3-like N-terminal domain-containing protein n=1 Tax=Hypsizygus marmoreus TaxID=39966 RepID=A0A369K9I0_HYPMA|nr:hypothetical protein Hypma_006986 [Hypsizygus marmoreus]
MFSHSSNVQIYGSSFNDVHGNMISYQSTAGDVIVHQHEFGLQRLMQGISGGAAFDSDDRYPPPRCHPHTRKEVVSTIEEWVQSCSARHDGSIFWLYGPAGAGKSAVAQTISESCARHGQLAASFFFSRGNSGRDSMSRLFNTIAFQLAMLSRLWRERINKIVTDDPSVVRKAPAIQLDKLIIGLFSSERLEGGRRPPGSPFLVVIDGLDECKGSRDQTTTLDLISQPVRMCRLPLNFLIVSRPEPHIRSAFNADVMHHICTKVSLCGTTDTQLYYNSMYRTHQPVRDVYTYLRSGFDNIHSSERHAAIMNHVPWPWPDNCLVESLAEKSGGYFIYASTILKYVDEEFLSPIRRLNEVVEVLEKKSSSSASKPFAELDELYHHILSSNPDTELLKQVLGYVMFSRRHLGQNKRDKVDVVIETIFQLGPGEVLLSLRGLHSLVSIGTYTELQEGVCRVHINSFDLFHASFEDFLFDESRAGKFFIDRPASEQTISSAFFDTFRNWAQMDIPDDVRAQICESFIDFLHSLTNRMGDGAETKRKFAENPSWVSLLCSEQELHAGERVKFIVDLIVRAHQIYLLDDEAKELNCPLEDGDRVSRMTLLRNYFQVVDKYIAN